MTTETLNVPVQEPGEDYAQYVNRLINHPDFRTLPSSGYLSASLINTELGRPAAQQIALGTDKGVRNLIRAVTGATAPAPGTPFSMGQVRGATAIREPEGTQYGSVPNVFESDPDAVWNFVNGELHVYNYQNGSYQLYLMGSSNNPNLLWYDKVVGTPMNFNGYYWENMVVLNPTLRRQGQLIDGVGTLVQAPNLTNGFVAQWTYPPTPNAPIVKFEGGLRIV